MEGCRKFASGRKVGCNESVCGESEKGLKVNGDKKEMMLGGEERSVCAR